MADAPPGDALPPPSTTDPLQGPRADLARAIPRRPRVSWWLGIMLGIGFALAVIPTITAARWIGTLGKVEAGKPAPFTVRVPPFAGYDTEDGHTGGGGVLVARGEPVDAKTALAAQQIEASQPHGAVPYLAYLLLVGVLAGLFTHHLRRSTQGRLLRVQLVSLALLALTAIAVKVLMLTTHLSVLVLPVALFAMVPTLVLDRVVGLATGTLAALVFSLLVPFDVGVAVMLLVQAGAAGLIVAERPKKRARAVFTAGIAVTLFTAATYPLMLYLTAGRLPLDELSDPLHSAWLASAAGPAIATLLSLVLVPPYQLAVGEITQGKLVELEDLSNPLLKQIAQKAPGSWQHSLMMANMAEIAANAIGASGRLVRVGAYYHDLGKSLQPKYFIENLEPGETSPHDKLPPEVSCDAIFAHVTEGIVTARKAGLHERIIDFMHMHHGNGVLEYFWGKCQEQGNPKGLTVEHFRYPGVPPQSRETAILSICDAVEAASRTLKKPDVKSIDTLVQRIVYGKLHLGQLDESGLSMGDLRRMAESLRETIRHANHSRIEYPWQKAEQDASAPPNHEKLTQTGPRLDSLDRPAKPDTVAAARDRSGPNTSSDALAKTDDAGATPKLRPQPRDSSELAMSTTAPATTMSGFAAAEVEDADKPTTKFEKSEDVVELRPTHPRIDPRGLGPTELAPANPPDESLARMMRATEPVDVKRPSNEAIKFAAEAKDVLDDASKEAAARTKAAALPAIKAPTQPPPLGRRSPTMPPQPMLRAPGSPSTPPNVTVAPPEMLRRPAAPAPQIITGVTAPPPTASRPPAKNLIDDMTTLRPQYEPRGDLKVEKTEGGEIIIQPRNRKPPPEAGDTAEMDHNFGTETPIAPPTRAELQALLNQPPDVTKQQSFEQLERLHREVRDRPEEDLDFTRRAPYPTAEVDEEDIEAAIELAPAAKRNAVIGVAKKPPKE